MRVALKKEFLDRLSMVLCIHRVYDFKYLGIPNMSNVYLTYLQENFKPVVYRSASVEVFDEEDAQVVHPLPSLGMPRNLKS